MVGQKEIQMENWTVGGSAIEMVAMLVAVMVLLWVGL